MTTPKQLASFALLLALGGCATEPPKPGIPVWDFEQDEVRATLTGAIIGGVLGAILDGNAGRSSGAVIGAAVGGAIQYGIELPAPELGRLIASTLAPSLSGKAARGALSLTESAPEEPKERWSIADSNEGQITTDWKPIPGRSAGILWWEKIYEAEVRHVITVKQSFREPKYSNISVVTQVRERPNSKYPWSEADSELGRTSFSGLRDLLVQTISAEVQRRRAEK